MGNDVKINDQLTVAGQPAAEDLPRLAGAGYRSVINLRPAGEPDQTLDPAAEGEAARQAGLQYVHLPMTIPTLTPELSDRFHEALRRLPPPVYVHCHAGTRAAFMTYLHLAREQGWTADQAVEAALARGFDFSAPRLREFFKQYLERTPREAA